MLRADQTLSSCILLMLQTVTQISGDCFKCFHLTTPPSLNPVFLIPASLPSVRFHDKYIAPRCFQAAFNLRSVVSGTDPVPCQGETLRPGFRLPERRGWRRDTVFSDILCLLAELESSRPRMCVREASACFSESEGIDSDPEQLFKVHFRGEIIKQPKQSISVSVLNLLEHTGLK